MSYKDSAAYRWYYNGDKTEDGRVIRRDNLPPFELNEDLEHKVAPGELFCRMDVGDGILCPNKGRFASESNLKTHIKKHKDRYGHLCDVKGKRKGSNSVSDNTAAEKFYIKLKAAAEEFGAAVAAHEEAEEDDEEDSDGEAPVRKAISTPSKLPGSHPAAAGSASDSRATLPMTSSKGKECAKPIAAQMRQGYFRKKSGKRCENCIDGGRKRCPPFTRTEDCLVWAHYKVHPGEAAWEEHHEAAGRAESNKLAKDFNVPEEVSN